MNPQRLHQILAVKRASSEPLRPEEQAKGFRGWYSSKYLPHFDSPGVQQVITYRLDDSVPVSRRAQWKAMLALEDDTEKRSRIEAFLDSGLGQCHLRDARIAAVVQENLWHHDGRSYRLLAWSLMPNHVHALIEQWQMPLGEILKQWKSYTAKRANKILGRTGAFWAEDYFDRFLRDEAHYRRAVRYIEHNPVKAGLTRTPEAWPWSSARYRSTARELVEYPTCTAPALIHPNADRNPPPPDTTS